jgi:ankyrin repeat protein
VTHDATAQLSIRLFDAVRLGDALAVRSLIGQGADVNAKGAKGNTPLHEAAWNSDPAVVALLIESGAIVNTANDEGSTPLHYVPSGKCETTAIVDLLLANSADANARDKNGSTPLHEAAWNKGPAAIDILHALLANGGNPDLEDNNGWTPLRHAEFIDATEMARAIRSASERSGSDWVRREFSKSQQSLPKAKGTPSL